MPKRLQAKPARNDNNIRISVCKTSLYMSLWVENVMGVEPLKDCNHDQWVIGKSRKHSLFSSWIVCVAYRGCPLVHMVNVQSPPHLGWLSVSDHSTINGCLFAIVNSWKAHVDIKSFCTISDLIPLYASWQSQWSPNMISVSIWSRNPMYMACNHKPFIS